MCILAGWLPFIRVIIFSALGIVNVSTALAVTDGEVSSVMPTEVEVGSTTELVVSGRAFEEGVTLEACQPADLVTIDSISVPSSTELVATISVVEYAETKSCGVRVFYPDASEASLYPAFNLIEPQPTLPSVLSVTQITPATIYPGSTQTLTISGTGFQEGIQLATCRILSIDSTEFVDDQTLTAVITAAADIGLGWCNLRLVNPDRENVLVSQAIEITEMPPTSEDDNYYAYIPMSLEGHVTVIDTATHAIVDQIEVEGFGPQGIEPHPDGIRIYVGINGSNGQGHEVAVIDKNEAAVIDTIEVGPGPEGMSISSDGSRLYVAMGGIHSLPPDGIDDTMAVVDLNSNEVIAVVPVEDHPWDTAVTHDDSTVFVANAHSETLSIVDAESNTVKLTKNLGDGNNEGDDHHTAVLGIEPDGERLWVAHMHQDILSVHDTVTYEELARINLRDEENCPPAGPNGVRVCEHSMGMAFHPEQRLLYVGLFFSDEVAVISLDTLEEIARVPAGPRPKTLMVHPNGETLWVVNQRIEGSVTIIDTTTLSIINTIPVGKEPIAFGDFILSAPPIQGE